MRAQEVQGKGPWTQPIWELPGKATGSFCSSRPQDMSACFTHAQDRVGSETWGPGMLALTMGKASPFGRLDGSCVPAGAGCPSPAGNQPAGCPICGGCRPGPGLTRSASARVPSAGTAAGHRSAAGPPVGATVLTACHGTQGLGGLGQEFLQAQVTVLQGCPTGWTHGSQVVLPTRRLSHQQEKHRLSRKSADIPCAWRAGSPRGSHKHWGKQLLSCSKGGPVAFLTPICVLPLSPDLWPQVSSILRCTREALSAPHPSPECRGL